MAMKLFVGSLPFSTTSEQLEELFAQYGAVVSAVVISDKFSGRSKGFGFVEMSDDTEAKAAIEALNGFNFNGRDLVVNEARPQEPRAPRSNDGGGYGGGRSGGGYRGGQGGGFRGGNDRSGGRGGFGGGRRDNRGGGRDDRGGSRW